MKLCKGKIIVIIAFIILLVLDWIAYSQVMNMLDAEPYDDIFGNVVEVAIIKACARFVVIAEAEIVHDVLYIMSEQSKKEWYKTVINCNCFLLSIVIGVLIVLALNMIGGYIPGICLLILPGYYLLLRAVYFLIAIRERIW